MGALGGRLSGQEPRTSSLSARMVAALVKEFGELKGSIMKVGQMLSYADLSLTPEARKALAVLQTNSPPSPWSHVQATINEDLGGQGADLLKRLETEPVASASIGQVHRSTLADGTPVAVKVRHPDIEESIRSDFRSAAFGTMFARLVAPGVNAEEALVEAQTRFLEECDYELEARRQTRFRQLFAGHMSITIPALYPEWSSRRVLTTAWHDGLDIESFLIRAPFVGERVRAARALYEFYVGALYRYGLFNADPHPGNLLFAPDGCVTILDHGCVREFEPGLTEALAELSRAVRKDDARLAQASLARLGMSVPTADFDGTREILRGLYAPLLTAGRRAVSPEHAITTHQVTKLKQVLLRVRLPGNLMFLFRARVGLYAVLARLGSKLNWIELEEELADGA
jgi:predicted unusual protein kinase regulating ubiquinone biosynthesis (AarF/ABC1/UbiB family)